MQENKNGLNISWVNTHLPSRKLTGLKPHQYEFCYVSKQYMKVTGWVECGVLNIFRFPYPLKRYIGEEIGMWERKTNRVFKQLKDLGFIEVSPCNQKFRVTDKFNVFKSDNNDASQIQTELENSYVANIKDGDVHTLKAKKIPFSESIYINDLDQFKTDLAQVIKTPDVDFTHYHETITNYYVVENPHIVYADWLSRCKKWIVQDQQHGKLIKVRKEKENLDPLAKLNDHDLAKELAFYYEKLMTPETDSFKEYEEIAEVFVPFAKEALKRGDRVLRTDRIQENVKYVLKLIKDKELRKLFDGRRSITQTPPVATIGDLAKAMKDKSG